MQIEIDEILEDLDICKHIKPGCLCPDCGQQHCSNKEGHLYDSRDYCIYCGVDGLAE